MHVSVQCAKNFRIKSALFRPKNPLIHNSYTNELKFQNSIHHRPFLHCASEKIPRDFLSFFYFFWEIFQQTKAYKPKGELCFFFLFLNW